MENEFLSLVDAYRLVSCVSKSGEFAIQNNDARIYLKNLSTKKIDNFAKKRHYLVKDISENEEYCVFVSNGETRVNVLHLPELSEIFSFNCNYIFQIGFISNHELILLDGTNEVRIVDFISKSVKIIKISIGSDFYLTDCHFVGNGVNISYYSGQTNVLKYWHITTENVTENTQKLSTSCCCCSQIIDAKVIISLKETGGNCFSIYIWDVVTGNMKFVTNIQGTPFNVKWIDDSYIWCSYSYSAFCNFFKIFDSDGKVLFEYNKSDSPLSPVYCRLNNHILASGFSESYLFRLKTRNQ